MVRDLLGRPRFQPDVQERTDEPGVAIGLAWTPVGGDVLYVEATSFPGESRDAFRRGEVDAVTFTSASTVRGFVTARGAEAIGGSSGGPPKMVCIGPVTAAAARDAGLRPAAVAKPHTIDGLIAALERALSSSGAA